MNARTSLLALLLAAFSACTDGGSQGSCDAGACDGGASPASSSSSGRASSSSSHASSSGGGSSSSGGASSSALSTASSSGGTSSSAAPTSLGPPPPDHADWPLPSAHPSDADYSVDVETVTDRVTGLMWQRNVMGTARRPWATARTDCEALNAGGFTDWSLPTVNELRSIVDQTLSSPAINATAFPGTPSTQGSDFWSSTPDAANDAFAWWVDASTGTTGTFSRTAFPLFVRCVRHRPAPPASRYSVDTAADTVTDLATGLTWQRTMAPDAVEFAGVNARCAAPWRVPTASELVSLVDFSRHDPAIDVDAFPGVTGGCAWSSIPSQTSGFAWRVCFDTGKATERAESETHPVRCVQGGERPVPGDAGFPPDADAGTVGP